MSHIIRLDIVIHSCGLTPEPSGPGRPMSEEQ